MRTQTKESQNVGLSKVLHSQITGEKLQNSCRFGDENTGVNRADNYHGFFFLHIIIDNSGTKHVRLVSNCLKTRTNKNCISKFQIQLVRFEPVIHSINQSINQSIYFVICTCRHNLHKKTFNLHKYNITELK